MTEVDERWMAEALAVAEDGLRAGELPIGAVVVVDDEVIASSSTQERTQRRLLVHAELLALDAADRTIGDRRGTAILYTTLEPCFMCLGAAATSMVSRIVYALPSPGDGAAEMAGWWDENRNEDLPHLRLPPLRGGILADEARALFRRYCDDRSTSADPFTAWARSLAGGPAS